MYIQEIQIRNLRSIREFDWSLAKDEFAGWHVLIGDNGSGKSTILKAIALALVGEKDAQGLRQNWGDWLKKDQKEGSVSLNLVDDTKYDSFSSKGKVGKKSLKAAIAFKRKATEDTRQLVVLETISASSIPPESRHVWGTGTGWFSVAYGPFRRFSGGNTDNDRLFLANPKLAAHLSVFGEDVALSEAIRWL